MVEQGIQKFIDNYTFSDFDRIKLKWNGEYGNKFQDDNYAFRMKVCECVIPQINNVDISLIRDLYCETGRTSPMTFSIYSKFHLLADELLKRGGKNYLLDYIRGAAHSMDASIMSGRLTISSEQAKELLQFFDALRSTTQDKEEQYLLNDSIRHRLEYYANKRSDILV